MSEEFFPQQDTGLLPGIENVDPNSESNHSCHLSTAELESRLEWLRSAPKESGILELIVRRPAENAREVLQTGELSLTEGLVGDTWQFRGSRFMTDGRAHPEMQLNVMNARAAELVAVDRDRRQLAGDQLYIDMDLSVANLPAGTRLSIGSAVIEVTAMPHNGCVKFKARFGVDAMRFVNSEAGKELRLRGLNAKVIQAGKITTGDRVFKLSSWPGKA